MMFLQFFLWGAWFVTLGPFMNSTGFDAGDIANAYTTAPIAAILAPVFLGMVADRFFSSEKVMGVLHILGGVLLCFGGQAAFSGNPWLFVGLLLAHMLCYMPTLGLSNTIAFNAISDPEKQFPLVRVWGTIGWIVAGFVVGALAASIADTEGLSKADAETLRASVPAFFVVAGVSGIVLGVLSFFLPHTPAPARGQRFSIGKALGSDALMLLKDRSFAVFMICSMLICIPLAAYYQQAAAFATEAGLANVPIKMTFGQMSEIAFMLVMPLMFARLGVKWMLAVGMLAWVARYALFAGAWAPVSGHVMWMIIGGIVLHGICYDFFFVTGQIYTEQAAPKHTRAQAQGFLVLATQGVGMLIGNQLFGRLVGWQTDADGTAWRTVWLMPAGFAMAVLVVFVLFFRGPRKRGGVVSGIVAEQPDAEPGAAMV
ncbi:MAG: MFS transporter [Phycisphaerae bacterium]|nr:MFS transporter [Phycisphaerae bacterium]